MLAAITGMRRGELFGLKWEDLDFERRTIRIVRSLVDQIEGKPKTETKAQNALAALISGNAILAAMQTVQTSVSA